jgi:medium-chain acyl-[acyl-carrier-protein] hydrolase
MMVAVEPENGLTSAYAPLNARADLTAWLFRMTSHRTPCARLFCFPHAGVGAAVFRSWASELPIDLDLCAVQLPGRTTRLSEPAIASIPTLVNEIAAAMAPYLKLPYAIFGHSMGAVLGFEVVRVLASSGLAVPRHLIVSGRRPPRIPDPDPPLHRLPDIEFAAEINRRYGGIPPQIQKEKEVLSLLLPALRADIAALETFRPPPRSPIRCPISAFGGADDALTPRGNLEAWREETTGPFESYVFPGGHFYYEIEREAVLEKLKATLAPMLAEARALSQQRQESDL